MEEAKDEESAGWLRRSCSAGEGPPPTIRGRRIAMHMRGIVLLEIVHDELQVKTASVRGQQNEDCEHTGVVDGSTMPDHVLPKLPIPSSTKVVLVARHLREPDTDSRPS